jgi:predicted nucleic acid-binding protein
MNAPAPRLLADCSTVAKWKLTAEDYAADAAEMLSDWEAGAIQVCVPDQLFPELASALLGSYRRHSPRLTQAEAREALDDLLPSPFTIYRTRGRKLLLRAFDIATQFNLRVYDCIYVALAERKRIEFWTADERLHNALHLHFPFVRWIAQYQRKRPSP